MAAPASSPFATSTGPTLRLGGRNYRCQCGQPVYFRNSVCLTCGTALGYDCDRSVLLPLKRSPSPTLANASSAGDGGGYWQEWPAEPSSSEFLAARPRSGSDGFAQSQSQCQAQSPGPIASATASTQYKRCTNLSTAAACNWLVAADDPHDFCRACRLNRTIPDLTDASQPDSGELWGLVELAKRRLVSSLIALGLPVASRLTEDPQQGLMFDLLRGPRGGQAVLTGHESGLITLNVDEADDATREQARKALHEPYRTLLGHFRHEVGHYYWDRLIANTAWLDGFHELFGDESVDYGASLGHYYSEGPPPDWPQRFVSAYASSHPWEDWSECWAHYLHMRDAVDTAEGFGLIALFEGDRADLEFTPFTRDALWKPAHPDAEQFLTFLNHWNRLTTLLNQMTRSMGQADFYPFTLPSGVLSKLQFIHTVVTSERPQLDASGGPEMPADQPDHIRRLL